jgi:hypothetical protein
MDSKSKRSGLTYGELLHLDALITMLQEQGLRLGDAVKAQSDVCCCGAVTAEAKGKFVFNEHDREIVRRIAELEQQIESSPTLGQLIEIRGELLRERMR